ncbi:sister chromatid cohesion protein PDS5 homolog A-like isoform X6 [Durio zibethinus]|uniref:Sister chromatid cohesion protein PDS5 homolog A-like isoform X6 n=1 Tax=Durio zibethinus TaxID=66656 RepID=A0A6P6B8R4_DURZI|nr:sister chromatid cohesion protein PDS5 homolog A-like isoform X6 [Durio zibethinus]
MDESTLQLISGIGSKLGQLARPNKDVLVKSLRQVASALSQIEQPSVVEVATKAQVLGKLEAATKPLMKSIVKHSLSNHTDKDVRLLVAICVSENFRILAPQPPFADKYLRDIFKLILSIFMELADTTSAFFSRRVKILETVARCKCCVVMLDIDCNDLILEMFNIFFSVVRDHHQQSLINDILSIMVHILNEEVSDQLMDVIFRNLIKEGKDTTSAASRLAASVIQSCAEKLQPFVCGFLTSCSLDRDALGSELKEFYHEIVLKIFQCAPEMLNAVIPNLTQELMISVRKKALLKVMEVYRDYCNKCAEGHITMCDHFEQIPCKVLMLCYDKDCKEFRSQNIELVISEDLFPVLLPVEERTRHWIHLFSLFSPLHLKALGAILSQKQRLQTEMRNYLVTQRKEKEHSSEDMQKKLKSSFVKMSASFPDPSKAEECFEKLSQIKDNQIFASLGLLLDELTLKNALATRDKFLKVIGNKHPHFEFLQLLSSKCLCNIFNSEHVCCILNLIASSGLESNHLEPFAVELLLVIISNFPSLMRGSELQFQMLFEEKYLIHDKIIQVLVKAGPHISVKFSDFYPVLKKICLEGTRTQSKNAVSAVASLIDVSKQYVLSELCEELVDSLHRGQNVATVLQSLGCIAQCSVSAFEEHDREITRHVYKKIFQAKSLDDPSVIEDSSECITCKLKIYALKMLVKSFLPHRGSQVNKQINPLLGILLKMLQKGDMFDDIISCARDEAYIRLAAAKSVLQLSRRWDVYISPDIFRFTILMAKDSSSFVRRSFLDKTHKLLKEHVIPIRYACSFTLATSDSPNDLQHDSFKYMAEFIKGYSREARMRQTSIMQGGSIVDYPAYIVVFLIHLLVHDADFPSEDCQDEATYAQFCRPLLLFLHASINSSVSSGDLDLVNDAAFYLNYIFRAIKRAKDAVDAQRTPRLHFLADIGISGVNSLNQNGISSSRMPGTILLPSSLYKITPMESEERNLKFLKQSFVERVVHIFNSQVSQHVDHSPCEALETHKKSTREDIRLEHRRRLAVSPNALGSDGSCNKVNEEQEYGAGIISEAALEKGKSRSAEASNGRRVKFNIPISLKELANANEVLIGQRIKVWSTTDSCFYSGNVDDFNPENNSHKITCDSGEVEILCLDSESWETISDCSLTEREVVLSEKPNALHFQQWQQSNTKLNMEDGKFPSRKVLLPEKKKKEPGLSRDSSSASEIINIDEDAAARRTRRRKV